MDSYLCSRHITLPDRVAIPAKAVLRVLASSVSFLCLYLQQMTFFFSYGLVGLYEYRGHFQRASDTLSNGVPKSFTLTESCRKTGYDRDVFN